MDSTEFCFAPRASSKKMNIYIYEYIYSIYIHTSWKILTLRVCFKTVSLLLRWNAILASLFLHPWWLLCFPSRWSLRHIITLVKITFTGYQPTELPLFSLELQPVSPSAAVLAPSAKVESRFSSSVAFALGASGPMKKAYLWFLGICWQYHLKRSGYAWPMGCSLRFSF